MLKTVDEINVEFDFQAGLFFKSPVRDYILVDSKFVVNIKCRQVRNSLH